MKKIVITAAIVGFCWLAVGAQTEDEKAEQTTPTLGLKAEANLSDFILSKQSNATSKMNIGASFGGLVNLNIAQYIALQGELLYHYKSSEVEIGGTSNLYQYAGMELAIYAVCQRETGRGRRIYIGLGPYSEFGFIAKYTANGTTANLYKKDAATQLSSMHDFNSGFGVMAGYEFSCGIQVNAAHKMSITNILDDNSSEISLFPQAVSVGIGYRFGK
jgi:hypothetical protein